MTETKHISAAADEVVLPNNFDVADVRQASHDVAESHAVRFARAGLVFFDWGREAIGSNCHFDEHYPRLRDPSSPYRVYIVEADCASEVTSEYSVSQPVASQSYATTIP